jgi:hypothetical protein
MVCIYIVDLKLIMSSGVQQNVTLAFGVSHPITIGQLTCLLLLSHDTLFQLLMFQPSNDKDERIR